MLMISVAAFIAYGLVIARCVLFALCGNKFRQDDRTEVAFILSGCVIYMIGHIALWVYEPWKVINNSYGSAIVIGFTIFNASYYFHRIGALMDGRDRRVLHRRVREVH